MPGPAPVAFQPLRPIFRLLQKWACGPRRPHVLKAAIPTERSRVRALLGARSIKTRNPSFFCQGRAATLEHLNFLFLPPPHFPVPFLRAPGFHQTTQPVRGSPHSFDPEHFQNLSWSSASLHKQLDVTKTSLSKPRLAPSCKIEVCPKQNLRPLARSPHRTATKRPKAVHSCLLPLKMTFRATTHLE